MNRFGALQVLLVGLVAIASSLLLLARVPAHTAYFPGIAVPFVLLGIGAGLAFLPLTTIAMADVPLADAGLASGIVNASLQIAAAIGVAALGTVAASRTKVLAGAGDAHAQALTGGFHLAWEIGAGAVIVGLLVALALLRPPARAEEVTAPTRVEVLEEREPVSIEMEAA
jgi:MFS family permease